ncbi:unnamed protein product [Caenorhabditis bovis]|uniref:Cadherin-like beta sandwich domain-containing protein n=1 Tax=Caenorhabditis bovis TaxID=2654633 RepID=A0A8S1EGU4_9PELO|nr:unnamed protein product [Caenorhabditis bovis]
MMNGFLLLGIFVSSISAQKLIAVINDNCPPDIYKPTDKIHFTENGKLHFFFSRNSTVTFRSITETDSVFNGKYEVDRGTVITRTITKNKKITKHELEVTVAGEENTIRYVLIVTKIKRKMTKMTCDPKEYTTNENIKISDIPPNVYFNYLTTENDILRVSRKNTGIDFQHVLINSTNYANATKTYKVPQNQKFNIDVKAGQEGYIVFKVGGNAKMEYPNVLSFLEIM